MLVEVAYLKRFEEVLNGKNSTTVVDRQEDKARSISAHYSIMQLKSSVWSTTKIFKRIRLLEP